MPAFEVCRSRTGIILHDFELKVLLMFGDLCETSETPKSVFAGNWQNKGMIGGPLVYDLFFTVHFPKTTKNDIVCNTRNIFAKKHFLKRRNFPAKRRNFPAKRRNFFWVDRHGFDRSQCAMNHAIGTIKVANFLVRVLPAQHMMRSHLQGKGPTPSEL